MKLQLQSVVWFVSAMLCSVTPLSAQEFRLAWELGPTGTKQSFRGIKAVSDSVVWISGADSTVLLSQDGGSSWQDASPDGYGELEFRSIHAWDSKRACIASAGTPAVILRTENGGKSWNEAFRHPSDKAFFDGLVFWDAKRGIVFGDPVEGQLCVMETQDAGTTWQTTNGLPKARDREAGFAASDSAMIVAENGQVWIGTGGAQAAESRVFIRSSWGDSWETARCPIPSSATMGIFSLARNGPRLVAVGGDYRPGQASPMTAAMSLDEGRSWKAPTEPPSQFLSAVHWLPKVGWIAIGPTGSEHSRQGDSWTRFTETGFHALDLGTTKLFAVGSEGRFAVLQVH